MSITITSGGASTSIPRTLFLPGVLGRLTDEDRSVIVKSAGAYTQVIYNSELPVEVTNPRVIGDRTRGKNVKEYLESLVNYYKKYSHDMALHTAGKWYVEGDRAREERYNLNKPRHRVYGGFVYLHEVYKLSLLLHFPPDWEFFVVASKEGDREERMAATIKVGRRIVELGVEEKYTEFLNSYMQYDPFSSHLLKALPHHLFDCNASYQYYYIGVLHFLLSKAVFSADPLALTWEDIEWGDLIEGTRRSSSSPGNCDLLPSLANTYKILAEEADVGTEPTLLVRLSVVTNMEDSVRHSLYNTLLAIIDTRGDPYQMGLGVITGRDSYKKRTLLHGKSLSEDSVLLQDVLPFTISELVHRTDRGNLPRVLLTRMGKSVTASVLVCLLSYMMREEVVDDSIDELATRIEELVL
jgi:hypothetical protein